jgi:hypothetical protein
MASPEGYILNQREEHGVDSYAGFVPLPKGALIRRIGPRSPTRTWITTQWGRGTMIAPLNWVAHAQEDDPAPLRSQAQKVTIRSPRATVGGLLHFEGS